MGKNYQRVKRGQVYWFDPTKSYGGYDTYIGFNGREYKSSIQSGNRPWLVTSNDTGNSTSPTCNIVPITLEEKASLPTHVYFTYEGKHQTILVEQPRTVDCMSLGEYMYTVSDELMEKVEKAIAIQHGIRPQVTYADFTLDTVLPKLEEVIGQIISSKVDAIAKAQKHYLPVSQVEDTALHLGQMIEDLVGQEFQSTKTEVAEERNSQPLAQAEEVKTQSIPHPADKPEKKPEQEVGHQKNQSSRPDYRGMTAVEKFNAKYNIQSSKPAEKAAEPQKKRNTWTIEKRQQYLEDCEKLSPQDVMKKYGFSTLQSVFQTKYQCKNILTKAGLLKSEA